MTVKVMSKKEAIKKFNSGFFYKEVQGCNDIDELLRMANEAILKAQLLTGEK